MTSSGVKYDAAQTYRAWVARARKLEVLVRRLEWPETLPGAGPWHVCPACSNHRDQGHEDDCWLAAELTKLEVSDGC